MVSTTAVLEKPSVLIVAELAAKSEKDAANVGARILERFLALDPLDHSENYPVEVIQDWGEIPGGRKAIIKVTRTKKKGGSFVCDVIIANSGLGDAIVSQTQYAHRFTFCDVRSIKGHFAIEGTKVNIKASAVSECSDQRLISLGKQITAEVANRCLDS